VSSCAGTTRLISLMLSIFSLILTTITGLANIVGPIVLRQKEIKLELAKVESDVERNKLLAEQAELGARQSVLIAEAGSRLNSIIRGIAAAGPIIYLAKIFIFDKVIGSIVRGITGVEYKIFDTDPLDVNLWKVVACVYAFYFLYDITARFRK